MFKRMNYGFWRQTDPKPFDYSETYVESQSTNTDMAYLRLGFIAAYMSFSELENAQAVDVGAGNRTMVDVLSPKVARACNYDVVGESISKDELYSTKWDLMIMSDVFEHMENTQEILMLDWKYLYLSFPETPEVDTWEQLRDWRHFKPDEHIWMFNAEGMSEFLTDSGIQVLSACHIEDTIRTRWEPGTPNITSMMLYRFSSGG